MVAELGQQSLLSIMSHLFFIAITFYGLQAIHFDKIIRGNRVFQARLLYILITVAIGSSVSNFFLDYLQWASQLRLLF